jgi:ABC-type glycerol-3-phosphate transport system permease component
MRDRPGRAGAMIDFITGLPLWLLAIVLNAWLIGFTLLAVTVLRRWVFPRVPMLSDPALYFSIAVMQAGFVLFGLATVVSGGAGTSRRALVLASTDPFDRGLLYTASALGTALIAFAAVSFLAERFAGTLPIDLLRHAGAMSLTLYVAHALVFNLVVLRAFFQGLPGELLDSARVDGAGEFRTFFRISLPLLAPGVVTVMLFNVVTTWNNYFLPLIMLKDPDWYPLTLGLDSWNYQARTAGGEAIFNLVITGSLLTIVPLIAAFLLLQRYWQSGLAAGSVKE